MPEPTPSSNNHTMNNETTVWEGRPSHWKNFPTYFLCLVLAVGALIAGIAIQPIFLAALVLPFVMLLWSWLRLKTIQYKLTDQRFFVKEGVFNRVADELELYRVKDMTLNYPFWLRIVGRGNITMLTSDRTHPTLVVSAIANTEEVRDHIRNLVEDLREKKHVREIDGFAGAEVEV